MIDFDSLPTTVLHEFKGGNGDIKAKVYADDINRIVKSVYSPGVSTGYHCHGTSCEIIFILSGSGKIILDGNEERISAGSCHYCKKGQSHAVINDSEKDLVMYSVVCNLP